jgi:preprotein translocase subunit YajC
VARPRREREEREMQNVDREMVQPGWEVWTSDGELLGKVIQIDGQMLKVKKGGLIGGEVTVPRDSIREVEEGRVEVVLTKQEATNSR